MFFDIYALKLCVFPCLLSSGHCFGGQLQFIHLNKYWGNEILYSGFTFF